MRRVVLTLLGALFFAGIVLFGAVPDARAELWPSDPDQWDGDIDRRRADYEYVKNKRDRSMIHRLTQESKFNELTGLDRKYDMDFRMEVQEYNPHNPTKGPYVEENRRLARQVKTARARAMLTRGGRSIARLGPHLITGPALLGQAAAGVWIHNGVVLYNAYNCGETNCPEELGMDTEFRQAEELANGAGSGSFFRLYDGAKIVGSGAITGFTYKYSDASRGWDCSFSWTAQSTATNKVAGSFGSTEFGTTTGLTACTTGSAIAAYAEPPPSFGYKSPKTYTGILNNPCADYGRVRAFTADYGGQFDNVRRFFGAEFHACQSYDWKNPFFDVGQTSATDAAPEYTPPAGDFVATPEETDAFVKTLRTDPEYDPSLDMPTSEEERLRRHGPLVDEWTNPDGSKTRKYQDGTRYTVYPDGMMRQDVPPEVAPNGQYTLWDGPYATPEGVPVEGTQYDTPPVSEPAPTPTPTPEPTPEPTPNPSPTPTGEACANCPAPAVAPFTAPTVNIGSVFPFSLMVYVWGAVSSLGQAGAAPSFTVMGQTVNVGAGADGMVSTLRTGFLVLGLCGIALFGWARITGKGGN